MTGEWLSYARYLRLVLEHKWYVLLAGLRTGAPLGNLLIHDWSKFTPAEAPHYARQFYGGGGDPLGFSQAWNHHQKINPHHWEYWVLVAGHGRGGYADGSALPMPESCVREMVADWLAATRVFDGAWPESMETWEWWQKSFSRLRLHEETRAMALAIATKTVPQLSTKRGCSFSESSPARRQAD